MFGCDVHAGLPPYWGVQGDRFQHSQADVTLDPCKNCFMPVEGNCGRFVYRLWCGFRVDMKLQWWTVLQQWKGLVLAYVEGRICIVVEEELFQSGQILRSGCAWKVWKLLWWEGPLWA